MSTLFCSAPAWDPIWGYGFYRVKLQHELKTGGLLNGIGWAIKQMQGGAKVCCAGWNGKGMWLALQVPDEHSKMSLPYIYMKTADNKLVPWLPSQTDILAIDWSTI